MNVDDLISYCRDKKGETDDFPFDESTLVFRVGGKIFALTSIDDEESRVNLKCDPELAVILRDEFSSVIPGYHMNKKHWNTVYLSGDVSQEKLKWMIDNSYDLVFASLKKSERERIQSL
jgi:predicted DNA-binding protein (MmcQ/YjbR family)